MTKVVKSVFNPKTILAAAVGGALMFALGPAALTAGSTFWGFVGRQVAISMAMSAVAALAGGTPKQPSFNGGASTLSRGRDQQFKQAITNQEVVYGRVRQSGPIIYVETTNKNKYLHLIVALAGHEINRVEQLYFNDQQMTLVPDGSDGNGVARYYATGGTVSGQKALVKFHLGSEDQQADDDLVRGSTAKSAGLWTNAHRLRGVAYMYVRLEFDTDAFPQGIPQMSVVMEGKKLYKVTSETTAYDNNPANVIYDYLTNETYGLGCPVDEIDVESFETAEAICNEIVSLSNGVSEKRYLCDGVVDTAAKPSAIIGDLLTSMNGKLVYSGGKWVLYAGAYRSSVRTITQDNIIGAIDVQTRTSRQEGFNAVKGVFISPNTNWQPTDYPAITSDVFYAEDNNERKWKEISLPFTTSSSMAQRIAKQILYRERQQVGVSMLCDIGLIDTRIGDTVSLTLSRYGWSAKTFEVIGYNLSPSPEGMGVQLQLKEISANVFDWGAEEKSFSADNTNLGTIFDVPDVGITLSDELRTVNETPTTFLIADISTGNADISDFEVQAKKSTDSIFINLGQASGNRFELPNVEENISYDVRARGINSLGLKGDFTTTTRLILGKTAPPDDVTDFSVNIIGEEAHLSWTPVADLDLSYYQIKHSSVTSGAKYSEAITLVDKVPRPANTVTVPAKTGTYFIKAVDKLGNQSTNASSSVALVSKVFEKNIVSTQTENPSFTGSKSLCSVVSNKLVINSGNAEAFYNFANTVDLGAKYQAKISSDLEFTRLERSANFDDAAGNFDDRQGLFDDTDADYDDIDVRLQFRFTDDNPSGTPTWSDWLDFSVTDVAARAFQFRVQLLGDSNNLSPEISKLEVVVDMPDRIVAEADVTSGAASKAITFSPAFKSLDGIGVTAQDLASGDYYEITGKSASGFTIVFKNSSDTIISRDFDYVAKGYGEVIT